MTTDQRNTCSLSFIFCACLYLLASSRRLVPLSFLLLAVALFFSAPVKAERILVPLAFSTPDTGFAAGAAVIWVVPNPEAGEAKSDSVNTFGFVSQKGHLMLALNANLYRDRGNILLEPSVAFGKRVSTRYGLGALSESDSEETYDAEYVTLQLKTGWNLLQESYLGPWIELQSRKYTDLSEAAELKAFLATNNESLSSTRIGLGVGLKRDTRDNRFYTRKGAYSEVALTRFDERWGSDYNFNRFELEHRRFITLNERSVLALQVRAAGAGGHIPYDQMPSIGGAQSLRGVLQDRYRDKVALAGQVEWRHILTHKLGVAVFSGVGDVFPSVDALTTADMKYALGVGGRYALGRQQRINLRLDLGYSAALGDAEADGFNVYFQVGEAF